MAFLSVPQKRSRFEDSLIPKCGECGLYKDCLSPKMPLTGEGKKQVLVVAEAPGEDEDRENVQLVGKAGRLFRRILESLDIDLDRDCWKTNSIICRPDKNRTPTHNEIDYCRPNLLKEIRDLNPRVIIPMGGSAVYAVIAPLWKEDTGPVSRWVGWQIPDQKLNTWICPTFHPSYVLRTEDDDIGPVVKLWFTRHLRAAFELDERPWSKGPPEFEKQVRVEIDPDKAAQWIREKIKDGGPCSFDYETDRLKPDKKESRIASCAICWRGKETIAYPLVGEAVRATGEFLQSKVPKIGANCKFEERWTQKVFGFPVRNWVHDTMLGAHHLDQRMGITGVKFQSYVRLGQGSYDDHIRSYLEADDSNSPNRIKEIELRDLLIYNGVDARLEWEIAILQKEEMRIGRSNLSEASKRN